MARILFMGSPEYAIPTLNALVEHHQVLAVITQPDKPVGRKKILTPSPVKVAALNHGLKVIQPEKIKMIEEELRELSPDFIVTAAFGQFLPESILNIPKYESLNLHGSILPKYRGGAPIQRAIMNLDKETGVSLMRMVKKMDAGPVFKIIKTPIESKTTGELMVELGELAAELILESLPLIEKGTLKPVPQDELEVTFAPIINRNDEMLNFKDPAVVLEAKIRALSPSPLPYVNTNHGPIKILTAKVSNQQGNPGEIIEVTASGICVATGEGSILLFEGIPAGKKPMKLSDFYQGHKDLRFDVSEDPESLSYP
jgi:methionyl-tRNA formyltransferase